MTNLQVIAEWAHYGFVKKRQIPRIYHSIVAHHLQEYRQMVFLMGPRQVGKTTTGLLLQGESDSVHYLNWDNPSDKAVIREGPDGVAARWNIKNGRDTHPIVMFDEIHKMERWKDYLKGFYDCYPDVRTLVTGSACMDAFRRDGDSLMGRYFPYRVHPLTIGELASVEVRENEFLPQPTRIDADDFYALWQFGGYPNPFLHRTPQYHQRWRSLRSEQLFRKDLTDLTRIYELDKIELLGNLLRLQAGQLVTYETLASKVRVANNTIRSWCSVLCALYYCFEIRPWQKNVSRSLIKEPKYYLYDWSVIDDPGARAENFVASHLLKAVHYWNDTGLGEYELYFLRDKAKREVDFLIVRANEPWMMVEVKYARNKGVSQALYYFNERLRPEYSFQVVIEMPYVDRSCFSERRPQLVSARTFLSQLI